MAPSKKSAAASASKVSETTTSEPVKATEMKKAVVDDNANVETTVVESEPDRYDAVIDKLQGFVNDAKELIAVVKALKKENARVQKQSGKRQRKVAADGSKRPASGITKPTKLSDDLCDFLGVPRGSSLARTEVTKIINTYIKTNKLQDETDKRTIHPDAKLKKILLPIPDGKKLSFFNMQSFIKHQFIKA